MKKFLLILALLWGAAAVGLWYWRSAHDQRVAFRTVPVHRGDLLATINATGTLEPEEVVDVGAQVAGVIQSFGADLDDSAKPIGYNSRVEQGTIQARLDDRLFQAKLNQVRATLARAEAEVQQAKAKLHQARRDLDRARTLQARGAGMISSQEVDNFQAQYDAAQATLAASRGTVQIEKANLEEATVNLGYTVIRSPVKQEIILDRRVNIGQTVVASLNTPSLFLIAKDLRRVEIWASVNETDIGAIHPGQAVRFTVGAVPHETFEGTVLDTRLNASMVQNVVTYTVVVKVDNPDLKLKPYLTARLQFEVERRPGVLHVPNAALRWRPRPEHVAPGARAEYDRWIAGQKSSPDRPPGPAPGTRRAAEGTLWVARGNSVWPVAVQVGLSDGAQTEISGAGVREGLDVVVGVERREDADDGSTFLPYTQTEPEKK